MADSLQKSVPGVETPRCPNCRIRMMRYRSIVVSEIVPQTVAHFFQCANCNRVEERQTRVRIIGPVLRTRDVSLEVQP
jgi:hypothetical protein